MIAFERLIKNILDVPGTEGIAFFDDEGTLLHKTMPDLYMDEIFADLGRRIVAIYEVVDENFITADDFLLKFPGRWIMMRKGSGFKLLLLTTDEVNVMSLKIVTNMALKQIKPEMFGPLPVLAASPAPIENMNAEAASAPEEDDLSDEPASSAEKKTPAKKRFYRGVYY